MEKEEIIPLDIKEAAENVYPTKRSESIGIPIKTGEELHNKHVQRYYIKGRMDERAANIPPSISVEKSSFDNSINLMREWFNDYAFGYWAQGMKIPQIEDAKNKFDELFPTHGNGK